MEIWLLAPSIRADAGDVFAHWRAGGYRVAALINEGAAVPENADVIIHAETYEGYGASINRLWRACGGASPSCLRASVPSCLEPIYVIGSDDLHPCETRTARDLAEDFHDRFPDGFGAMHLAAHDLSGGRSTDHLWLGAEYCRRINRGRGPIWPQYFHYFDDTEAGLVAEKLGALWRRPDVGQRHDHWSLGSESCPPQVPAHLSRAQAGWNRARELFERRQARGFPGSDPAV